MVAPSIRADNVVGSNADNTARRDGIVVVVETPILLCPSSGVYLPRAPKCLRNAKLFKNPGKVEVTLRNETIPLPKSLLTSNEFIHHSHIPCVHSIPDTMSHSGKEAVRLCERIVRQAFGEVVCVSLCLR